MVKAFPLNQQEYSYNAQDVSYYYAGRHSGVFDLDTNCKVSVVSGMDIKVSKGKGWLAHKTDLGIVFWMDEDMNLSVPVGDTASPRWDYVCVGWETTEVKNNPTIYIKSGSPAVTPLEPILENSVDKIEICLAKIYVPSGTTNLLSDGVVITDTRADKAYCGLVGDDLRTTNLEERATSLERRTTSLEERVSDSETEINKIKNGTTSVGEAEKAKKLTTARTINGTSFDGSSNITTAKWGQGRNITIDGITKLIDGSANIDFNTINFYRVLLVGGQKYVHNGCTKVGEKHLIKISVSNTSGHTGDISIQGQGVKQFVFFFQNNIQNNSTAPTVYCREIDVNNSYTEGFRFNGFVFIIGVPN